MGKARWSTQQVGALAPDAKSMTAARGLTSLKTWSDLGCTDSLVWGKCQGSGKTPYQVTVDLTEPAFKCTCPSRKFPCKHGLALLLIWVEHGDAVADAASAADFADGWASQRSQRSAKRSARGDGDDEIKDPEAQARRRVEREATMGAGIDDFERWLDDLVRQGLAAARQQSYTFWDGAGARLVDAQLPGLADRVRAMSGAVVSRDDWADHLLAEAGRWQLAIEAWRRRSALDEAIAADLRTYVGWSYRSDELSAFPTAADRWVVAGVRQGDDGRILSQRTWLWGQATRRWTMILDFAAAGAALRTAQTLGSVVDDALTVYPGNDPPRVALSGRQQIAGSGAMPSATSIHGAVDQLVVWLAANPWRDRLPVALDAVTFVADGDRWWLQDDAGDRLPIAPTVQPWSALAVSGGRPAVVVGEWDDGLVHPLAIVPERAGDPVPL